MGEELSIQPYLNNVEFLRLTAKQIERDFSFYEVQLILQADTYDGLYEQLLPFVNQISKNNANKLHQLLYRIDISEMQIKNESHKNLDLGLEEIITQLIIKRCLQKVVLKKLFS